MRASRKFSDQTAKLRIVILCPTTYNENHEHGISFLHFFLSTIHSPLEGDKGDKKRRKSARYFIQNFKISTGSIIRKIVIQVITTIPSVHVKKD